MGTEFSPADRMEQRTVTKGNSEESHEGATQRAQTSLTGLQRVREAARKDKKRRFSALLHHITTTMLTDAYHKLNPKASVGIDGVTWQAYGKGLSERIEELHRRIHNGSYRAKPSKRVWIPKADGSQRPIGMAALEDKIVQQALGWVLESIYEVDFQGFSYGFRPGRRQHDALDALYVAITQRKVSWVLDADIKGFFDTISHEWMMRFLEHRIADQRVLRLIRKMLRAGVSEQGEWSKSRVGTPQGAVISPLLANIYLHYALDLWVASWRKAARGEVYIVRYADDFVMGFQYRDDAERMSRELEERLKRFELTLHPEKTRLIEFGRFAQENRKARGEDKPESFDFLGFTHLCSKRRSDGKYALKRITIAKRMREKLDQIRTELRRRMHHKVWEVGRWLRAVVNGYANYHSIPGNSKALSAFRAEICRMWIRVLRRRSQKSKTLSWERCRRLFAAWIPSTRIRHPYPNQRLSLDSR